MTFRVTTLTSRLLEVLIRLETTSSRVRSPFTPEVLSFPEPVHQEPVTGVPLFQSVTR